MADGEGEYQIRIGAESTQADGALDSFAAKQANLKNQTEDAAAVAQKWGVSLETAQAALDKNREIEKAMQINALE